MGFPQKSLLARLLPGFHIAQQTTRNFISAPRRNSRISIRSSHPLRAKHSFSWIFRHRGSNSRSCSASHVIFCLREIIKALWLHKSLLANSGNSFFPCSNRQQHAFSSCSGNSFFPPGANQRGMPNIYTKTYLCSGEPISNRNPSFGTCYL